MARKTRCARLTFLLLAAIAAASAQQLPTRATAERSLPPPLLPLPDPTTSSGRRSLLATRLDQIRLPPLFRISLYASGFPARFMALGRADADATVVFVSSTTDRVRAPAALAAVTASEAAPAQPTQPILAACRR